MLKYEETPFQEISDPQTTKAGVRLLIKREDLNHPLVSGNKWWKLKYNLEEAVRENSKALLTYGGAFSNHIFSTAAAAAELNMKSIGIIRGEQTLPLNPVLAFAISRGMQLHYVSRSAYRTKSETDPYLKLFDNFYLIPEGGSNLLALKGVVEFVATFNVQYDYVCCPVGTGGTLSGIIEGTPPDKMVIGFTVVRGGSYLVQEIQKLSRKSKDLSTWKLMNDYHFGGYAKNTLQLERFMQNFANTHSIPLDPIYTGKMMAGIYDLLSKGFFARGSTILAIHTGGLQAHHYQWQATAF
jgi:1-aminocyclopropane-1-carboxylate deaminase